MRADTPASAGPAITPDVRSRLARTRDWVFDLDNTLYSARSTLLSAIGVRMTDYVSRLLGVDVQEAAAIQHRYYLDHGATLTGLVHHHGADPHDFLHYVHDVPALDHIAPDPELAALIAALPGRKFVFTNGGRAHADRVTRALGLESLFDAHFAIEDGDFTPKPQPGPYARLVARHGLVPEAALMVEDTARNLAPAHALGMTTVLVAENLAAPPDAHVHHVAEDLKRFLTEALGADL